MPYTIALQQIYKSRYAHHNYECSVHSMRPAKDCLNQTHAGYMLPLPLLYLIW